MPSPLAISPDGRSIAFIQSQANPDRNDYCRQLIVIDLAGNLPPRILDSGGEFMMVSANVRGSITRLGIPAAVTPGWSFNGRSLAYLRRDHGITQLWRVEVATGEAAPVTASPVDIEQWTWAGDDRVVVASRPGLIAAHAKDDADGRQGWLYDARFSPQVSSRPQPRGDVPLAFDSIALTTSSIRPASASERGLLDKGGVGTTPEDLSISDGSGGRYHLRSDGSSPLSPSRIYHMDPGGKETRCAANECVSGIVSLFRNGAGVVFLRREGWAKSRLAFYRWAPSAARPTRLWETGDVLLGCLPRRSRLLCLRETSVSPRRIVEIEHRRGSMRTIYDPNPAFASFQLGTVRRLMWRNAQGLPAWGDLALPPGWAPAKKVPLVVVQYRSVGFLRGGTGDEYPILPLAARGFAVLSVENPPPIVYAMPNLKTWDEINQAMMKDWADRRSLVSSILTGVSKVVALGIADPARIGITGLSDGASSARFALINSRVFSAAAISSSALEPKTVMTYGGFAWADFNRALGYPPASRDDPAFWRPASFAINADKIDVPILIQSSDDEYLLSLETITALREHGKPVEMIVYPNEHHVKWQPAHRLATYQRTIDWFAFWFQGAVDPDAAKAVMFARWSAMRTISPTLSKRSS